MVFLFAKSATELAGIKETAIIAQEVDGNNFDCDIFILAKKDFDKVLKTYPEFLDKIKKIAEERYKVKLPTA